MNLNEQEIIRFWEKVDKSDDASCWNWTASKRHKGYGAFVHTMDGKYVQGRAHRFSYMLHIGEIPSGMFVLHKCDNPACVNPSHLFLGTNHDNVRDMVSKGRHVPGGTHCKSNGKWKKGINHHNAKLTPQAVREIRLLHGNGMSCPKLGVKFGVTTKTIWTVVKGERWKHVV
ncbi:MAG: HNH endonuclease signature motif containing protein [Phycisphaerales bacterium]